MIRNFIKIFYRKPDKIIYRDGKKYLHRWHIIPRNKWFNVYLHHFVGPNIEPLLHDHPWYSLSYLFKGSYIEHSLKRPNGKKFKAPYLLVRSPDFFHKVEFEEGAWTIFITGPNVRPWGFLREDAWVSKDDYIKELKQNREKTEDACTG